MVQRHATLGIGFSGTVKLTGNADCNRYKYSGYGIGFDTQSQFSWSYSNIWVGNSSSVHFYKK